MKSESMQRGDDRFSSFLVLERARHKQRLRFAALMAALISILLYQTQWLVLRPGLTILLIGQAGVVLSLIFRNAKLSKDIAGATQALSPAWFELTWFDGEESFVKRLAIFESACQTIGFATLGYKIWFATNSLLLALAIGFVYPATAYFGITRARNRKTIMRLRTEREEAAIRERARQ